MRDMAGACAKTGVAKEAARSVRTRLRSVNMICLFAVGGFRRRAPRLRKRLDPSDAIKERPRCEWGGSGFSGSDAASRARAHWPWLTSTRLQPALIFGRLA